MEWGLVVDAAAGSGGGGGMGVNGCIRGRENGMTNAGYIGVDFAAKVGFYHKIPDVWSVQIGGLEPGLACEV